MQSANFLEKYRPGGPWVVTAISLDRKNLPTQTFTDKEKCQEWVDNQNKKSGYNVYFHVNPAIKPSVKKLDREDILSVEYLHVDIDPPKGQPSDQEFRDSTLNMLLDNRPKGVPEPTIIVFSGGGFAAFWKLNEPIPVNGDIGLAEDAKLYNKQLEIVFGADNCHNIDRLMRLPYTTNIPDAKKKKAGRVEETAKVLRFSDKSYDLSEFKKHVPSSSNIKGKNVDVNLSDVRRIDINELDEYDVPERVKIICVQGMDHENPKEGDNSRSAWLLHALCSLIRKKVPDQVIFSIITDPGFLISESILDLGDKAEAEAVRQINKAKELCVDTRLVEFNTRFAVIGNMGGKCRVVEEVLDTNTDRYHLTKQSFADFTNRFMNQYVQVGKNSKTGEPKYEGAGRWWLSHPDRRQYDRLVFAPGKELTDVYNLWRGFSVPAKEGDCSLYLDHVKRNICAGDEECYQYLIRWMARAVQNPDQQGSTAVVLRGEKGTGKSVFADEFGAIFGRHYISVSNASHLVGNFNAHLRDSVVVFADEAFHWTDKKHESTLKTLITEDTFIVEAKSVDAEISPNFVHLIMASNSDHVISASGLERRFLVLDVAKNNCQDTEFFNNLVKQMESGGRAALLHHLMNVDLTDFEVRTIPQTAALQDQKIHSLSIEEEWWYNKLQTGQVFYGDDKWCQEIEKESLYKDFLENARNHRISHLPNRTKFWLFMRKVLPGCDVVMSRCKETYYSNHDGAPLGEKRVRKYFLKAPDLDTCRRYWRDLYKGTDNWEYEEERLPFE